MDISSQNHKVNIFDMYLKSLYNKYISIFCHYDVEKTKFVLYYNKNFKTVQCTYITTSLIEKYMGHIVGKDTIQHSFITPKCSDTLAPYYTRTD